MGICQSVGTPNKKPYSSTDVHKSKASRKKFGEINVASSPRNFEQQSGATQYLRSFLEEAEDILGDNSFFKSPTEKKSVSLTFLNSCVEVTRTKFRLKMGTVVDIMTKIASEEKLEMILSTLPEVTESCVDDGFARLLNAWFASNTGLSKETDGLAGQTVVGDKCRKAGTNASTGFSEILANHLYSANLVPAMNLFWTFAQNGDIMTVDEFGRFLREAQCNDVTDNQVIEKYKYRFGGAVHRYNFNTYVGSLLTNNALDPSRMTNVWQDMTQPLTRYLINTTHIESEDDLKQALSDGSRAFVLNINKNDEGVLCSGKCTLDTILTGIKTSGFLNSPYPIILCLSPSNPMSLELKEELAENLSTQIGHLLAKGLMFEGAIISDPKFSPAAQRKRVLVLGFQRKLKPFVGIMVADMNRDGLGVRLTDVVEGTPAAKAGLRKDDWLTHIDGVAIQNKQYLRERLDKLQLGEEFTLKRENLEEIKVVVGSTVDPQDNSESEKLSKILFLKYTEKRGSKPWETLVFTTKTICNSSTTRKDLDDHFAFFSTGECSDNVNYIDIATRIGIQLVDIRNTRGGWTWAHGRFLDNGRSGYLIKSSAEEEGSVDAIIDIIAGPQEIKGPSLTKGVARIYGSGSARVSGKKITFKGCNDATVAVIDCDFVQHGSSFHFTTAFPPALLRAGYRVLPLQQVGGPKELAVPILGAYCFIHRST